MAKCSKSCVPYSNGLKFLIVSHHFAKFCGYTLCSSSDTAAKIMYLTLQDHVIRKSGDFKEGNSLLYISALPELAAIDVVLKDM